MEDKGTIIASVVAHIDHGKTSLIDSLVASQGRISRTLAGSVRFLDTREDEQTRGITLKLSAISLEHNGYGYVFIDTPGHVDFESLIQSSSIFSDNFLILVDVNEGITPRTYSLVKYTKGKRCVLALNKIDKISSPQELLQKILLVVSSINGLAEEDLFEWEANNVILCCATLCYGINRRVFQRIIGKDGTLKNAIDLLFHIYKKIEEKDVDKICERFRVAIRSRKNILSAMFSLSDCVFDSISWDTKDHLKMFLESDLINLNPIPSARAPSLVGVTVYGILKTPRVYTRASVLFVTRLFCGTVRVGDTVYSADGMNVSECIVESLYLFGINELIEKNEVSGSNLVCMGGNFLKNSLITDVPVYKMNIQSKITPFYKFKLALDDIGRLDELKEVFRVMSCTEQFLKVRLNKYKEMEVSCTGRVQSEKIITDLIDSGFEFTVSDLEEKFCEYAMKPASQTFALESLSLNVLICRAYEGEENTNTCFRKWEDKDRNQFVLVSDLCFETVANVLGMFVSGGPLIREKICETRFILDLKGDASAIEPDTLYSFLKNSLASVYLSSNPSIAPIFYECSISIQEMFIGEAYKSLSKHSYAVVQESYEEKTGFYVLTVLIPQFLYSNFLEEIRVRTKGTAYLLVKDVGYRFVLDFNRYIEGIRKKKGLFIEEKIVESPSKQRTYKK
ncbi:translation elongation factor 2 [Encephalitozoon romaleae SJ-2008]|uniref:Translation elongation factor 2 n=1 Tax=Encephalitozoon romaleae (strain SJ-2008) TaxID=1178016 RepID=I7AUC3_ENCRO|nr:translation elongation factor 2 [Encephalitozoon romaleae SJ-2008]AFN84082.1 translation elongation factor 2 [Encephalitozoon romaleae SJ-2008]